MTKRLADGLMGDFDKCQDPEVRAKLSNAVLSVIEAQRILLRVPGPGREQPSTPPERIYSDVTIMDLSPDDGPPTTANLDAT